MWLSAHVYTHRTGVTKDLDDYTWSNPTKGQGLCWGLVISCHRSHLRFRMLEDRQRVQSLHSLLSSDTISNKKTIWSNRQYLPALRCWNVPLFPILSHLCLQACLIGIVFFFLRFFFLMWTIFKVFIELVVTALLLFYVLVCWPRAMGDLSSLTRDGTHTPCIRRRSLNHCIARGVPLQF